MRRRRRSLFGQKYDFHFYVTNGRAGSSEMGYESRAQWTVKRELRTGPQTGIINRCDINSVQFCCCWCCLPGRAPDTKKNVLLLLVFRTLISVNKSQELPRRSSGRQRAWCHRERERETEGMSLGTCCFNCCQTSRFMSINKVSTLSARRSK